MKEMIVTIGFSPVYRIYSGRETRTRKLQLSGEISSRATHLGGGMKLVTTSVPGI